MRVSPKHPKALNRVESNARFRAFGLKDAVESKAQWIYPNY